jgi:hypothetical protein
MRSPGMHWPTQLPFTQAVPVQVLPVCQRPFWSQLRGVCPWHSARPGVHSPAQVPPWQLRPLEQVVPQQGWPKAPQATQPPERQVMPLPQPVPSFWRPQVPLLHE